MTSPIQMAGLSNGLDAQSMIDKLLEVESAKITTVQTKKVDLEADVAAWGDISSVLSTLTDSLDDLRDLDTWNKMLATASNTEKLSATASSSATPAVYSMTITSLAQAHSVGTDTAATISGNSAATSTTNLVGAGLTAGETFTIEGQVITIDATTESLTTLAAKINTAAASMADDDKVTATIIGDRLVITRDNSGSAEIAISDTSGTPLLDLGIQLSKPIVPSGSTLRLEMATNTSPTVTDTSGNGYNGTVGGAAAYTASGQFDGAYNFVAATTDRISLADTPELDSFDEWTWSVWVKTSTAGTQTVMNYGDLSNGADNGINLALNDGVATVTISDGTRTRTVTGDLDVRTDGEWHLITVTNDGERMRLYQDGVAVSGAGGAEYTADLNVIEQDDHDNIEIGRRYYNNAAGQYFTGSIDEVMIYKRALTDAEIASLMPTDANLIKNELVEAQDAVFTVNGAEVTRSSNTNLTDVISNVTLNLYDTASSSDGLKLTVGQDTETPKTAIETFITSYNAAVSKLQSYINVNLTDPDNPDAAQLQGDTMVGTILYSLRRLVGQAKSPYMDATNASYTYNSGTGILDSLDDIGVWTEGKDNAIAITDSTKLDYMLANYFEKVEQMMRGVYSEENGYEHGVATDLYNYSYNLSTSLTGEIAKHVDVIEDNIGRVDTQIEKMLEDLDDYEQRLWSQFGAMDDAVGAMQSQMNYLSSLVGSD